MGKRVRRRWQECERKFAENTENARGPTPVTDGAPARRNLFSNCVLLGVVAFAPLPFGSHDPLAEAFWCFALAIALTTATPRGLKREHLLMLGLIGAILCGFAFILYHQLRAADEFGTGAVVWEGAARLIGSTRPPVASLVRYQPFFSLGPTLASAMALALGIVTGADRGSARRLVRVFAWSGAVYALYGIFAALIAPNEILWREREGSEGIVVGPFIARNTAATYFGSCAIVWCLTLSEDIRNRVPRMSWLGFPRTILTEVHVDLIVKFIGFFVCFMALIMTNSRAGVTLSLLAITAGVLVTFWRMLPKSRARLVASAVATMTAIALLQTLAGVRQRFETAGFSDEGRFDVYRATMRMISDHVWIGTGLGTFAWAFPVYREIPPSMWGIWDMAHGTPIEMAAELGIPLASAIAAAFLAALLVLARGIAIRRRDRVIPLSAFLVAVLGILHSTVDFSLQIPGYTIPFMALLGSGLAQSFRSDKDATPGRPNVTSSKGATRAEGVLP